MPQIRNLMYSVCLLALTSDKIWCRVLIVIKISPGVFCSFISKRIHLLAVSPTLNEISTRFIGRSKRAALKRSQCITYHLVPIQESLQVYMRANRF